MSVTDTVIQWQMVDSYSTPLLVRRYKDLHVIGSHQRLVDAQHTEMLHIVNELRLRRVLD